MVFMDKTRFFRPHTKLVGIGKMKIKRVAILQPFLFLFTLNIKLQTNLLHDKLLSVPVRLLFLAYFYRARHIKPHRNLYRKCV